MDEADIRRRIDKGVKAIRSMDLNGVMALYAPDIVSFDIEAVFLFPWAVLFSSATCTPAGKEPLEWV